VVYSLTVGTRLLSYRVIALVFFFPFICFLLLDATLYSWDTRLLGLVIALPGSGTRSAIILVPGPILVKCFAFT
jgi:hypothetical protein